MVWTVLNDCDDKTTLPNYLKDLYSREPQQVDSLLSTLINPYDSKNSLDVEKCLWVICGGQKPEDFTRIIKSNDRSVICGLVWDANFIAYRCKTCGITPCMSLCAECFENGDHEGHDFNMFKSGAGGACDCGDVEVMKPCGFCSRHGPKSAKSYREIPDDVTLMVNLVVPKLIDFLLYKLEYATADKPNKVDRGDEEVAKLLLQLCEMGDITRNVVAQGMLQVRKKSLSSDGKVVFKGEGSKPTIHKYSVMRRQSSTDNSQPSSLPDSGIQNISDGEGAPLQSVADSILSLPGPSKECDLPYLGYEEEKKTVLETLLDLLIELKFPQYLVTLVLSMLQETDYKQQFMEAFCSRYAKIANLLTHRFEPEEDQKLCNRLVHASVQLFSNENLTFKMVQNNNLLSIIVSALSDLISRTLIKVDHDTEDNVNSKSLFVVNCNHDIISQHRYWPVVSDFHNLLSHSKIARHFLGEAALIRRWMGILTHFTGMNKNIRHLIVHIPYESNVYQYAYSTEIEASSHIMTNLLSVCASPSESDHIRLVLSECVRALRSWFRMIQVQIVKPFLEPLNGEEFTPSGPIPRHEITFHLPLHRYLAGFISQAINYCGMSLEEVLPSEEVLWCVMEHVLRIQVGIGEILSGLWVRNGYSLRSQEEFYLQGQYCNQCVDLDIFLLQVCVMALDSDLFLTTLLQRYKLDSWFRFGDFASSTQPADNDVQQALVESMLNLILQLVYQRMYMGLSEEKMVHLEVVTKLTMGDFTHSQLTDNLPEKPGISELTELFDEVLSKVSDYKQPTNESGQLTQGIYALKPDLWKSEFQPLHVMLRGSYKRGYQLAMDKYKGWYQSQNKTKVQGLWPPFRTPLALNPQCKPLFRILHSRTLHAMLFTVLYKAMKETDTVNDNMIYLTFYLLDLCIDAPEDIATPVLERGSLKPDITVAEQEDGTVPQAIVKCILFLQEHRDLPTLYKGKAVEQRVQELCRKLISSPHTFIIKPDQYSLQDVTEALLLMCNSRLQPPLFARLYNAAKQLSLTTGIGTAMYDKKTHMYHIQQVLEQLPPHRYKMINLLIYYLSTLVKEEIATLEQICTVYVPEGVDHTAFSSIIRCYDWIFRVRKRHSDSLESMFDIKYKSDRIVKNAYQCVMGTSLIQCMYEIRKKLSQIDFSQSPGSSNAYTTHNGVEAITKILEKLCERDQNNAKLLRSLERADASTPDRSTSPCSTSEAKRKRAKERQAKLLQQFASKQRIFEAQMEAENLVPFAEEEQSEAKQTYSCIICSIDSVNTEMKPIATFVLCQPASLLLHCTAPQIVLVVGDSITRLLPTTAPGIDVKTFPGIDSERLLKEVESHPEKYRGDYEYTVVLVGANNLGRRNLQSSVTCVKKIMEILSDLNPAAMALACEVMPRERWTRHVPLFSTDPNTCAKDFNDLLIAEVGKQHVIPLYSIFLDHDRSKSLNIDTSNRKLFKADGLHPNKGGSKMISGAIIKFLHCNEGKNPALVTASAVTQSRIVPTGVSIPSAHSPQVQRLRQPVDVVSVNMGHSAEPPSLEDFNHYPCLVDNPLAEYSVPLVGFCDALKRTPKPAVIRIPETETVQRKNHAIKWKPVTDHAFTTDFQKADMKSFYMAMKRNSGDAAIKSVTRRKTLNKRQPSRNQDSRCKQTIAASNRFLCPASSIKAATGMTDKGVIAKVESRKHKEKYSPSVTETTDQPCRKAQEVLIGGGTVEEDIGNSEPPKKKPRGRSRSKSIGRKSKSSRVKVTVPDPVSTSAATDTDSIDTPRDQISSTQSQSPTTRAERVAAWKKTLKGKASISKSNRAYRNSKKGRETTKNAQERYMATKPGAEAKKEAQARYASNESGSERLRQADKKYASTEGRWKSTMRYFSKEKGAEARRRAYRRYRLSEGGAKAREKANRRYEITTRKYPYRLSGSYVTYRKSVNKAIRWKTQPKSTRSYPDTSSKDNETNDEVTSNKEAMTEIRSYKVPEYVKEAYKKNEQSIAKSKNRLFLPHLPETPDSNSANYKERAIMDERFEDIPTLHSTLHDHYNTLKMLFTSASTWQGVGQRAQPGLHVQSCCHYLHVECYKTYSDSQRSRSSDPLHNPLKGKELSCPTCRRLSNTVLPLPPEPFFKPYTPTEVKVPVSPATQIPLPFTHSCQDKSYLSSNPLTCLGCSSHKLHAKIKQVMQQAPIDLVNATILKATKTPYYTAVEQFVNSLEDYYKKYVEQKTVSQQDILVLSLHTTLQCELIERNNTLVSDLECSRKYCTGRLISVLATQSSMLIECHSSNDLLLELIGMLHSGGPGPSTTGKKASSGPRLPLVLQEPSWILLKFVLFSKLQSDWENFVTVVRLLFTLQTMRALHSVVAKFSQDEQLAWSRKNISESDDFQALLGVTCRELSRLGVHATVGEMDITSYVWSLQSIETSIQSLCVPLLREAVLLGHHMYEKPLPTSPSTSSELLHLAAWLDLIPSSSISSSSSSSTVKVLNLPRDLLLKFSCDLVGQLPLPRDMPHSPLTEPLMPLVQNWGRPRLLTLPRLYGKLYLHYRHVKCKVCKGVPHDPALCLVCGQLVCVRSQCCQWLSTGECTKHAQKCGAGTAIYLVIMSSTVVIIRGERVYLWGSVYLDQHDEEDIDLKRGKPLYLSETRYNCLNQQWISHSFDHTLKRWGWHQQQF